MPPIVTGEVIHISNSIFSSEDRNPRHDEECRLKYNGVNIFHRNLRPVHDQCHFRNGNVPHPTGHGHIRPTGLPVIRDKVFDGHFRTVFQPGGKIDETAVQLCGLLRVQFAPFGGLPGSFPYCRLVARQRGKRRELCGF